MSVGEKFVLKKYTGVLLGLAMLALYPCGRAQAQTRVVDFNDLPANNAPHNTYTQNGFTLAAIGSQTNHFHAVLNPFDNTTAALFSSDDGSPFGYTFGGDAFDLISIDVVEVQGVDTVLTLTSSSGATAVIDASLAGATVTFDAGFAGITLFQHDIDGEGSVTLDNIVFQPN